MTTPDINKILREHPRHSKYGAPFGHHDVFTAGEPLHLQLVRMVDGDYGPDGTYWGGGGEHLWCAFSADGCATRIYVRAWTRNQAVWEVLDSFPDATFKRAHWAVAEYNRVKTDVAINAMKNSGELRQRDDALALAYQINEQEN